MDIGAAVVGGKDDIFSPVVVGFVDILSHDRVYMFMQS